MDNFPRPTGWSKKGGPLTGHMTNLRLERPTDGGKSEGKKTVLIFGLWKNSIPAAFLKTWFMAGVGFRLAVKMIDTALDRKPEPQYKARRGMEIRLLLELRCGTSEEKTARGQKSGQIRSWPYRASELRRAGVSFWQGKKWLNPILEHILFCFCFLGQC